MQYHRVGQTGGGFSKECRSIVRHSLVSPLDLQMFDFVVNGALNHPLGNCVNCVYGNFKNIKDITCWWCW